MPGRGQDLSAFWRGLDPSLRDALLLGSCGRGHLLAAARAALNAAPDLGPGLVLAALAGDPLDGTLAGELLHAPQLLSALPTEAQRLVAVLARDWNRPGNLVAYEDLAAQRDFPALRAFLDQRLDAGEGLFWLSQAVSLALFENDQDWLARSLARPVAPELAPAQAVLRGQAAFLAGRPEQAREHFAAASPVLGPALLLQQGLCVRALGDRQGALALYRGCLDQAPWQSSAALLAADLLLSRDQALAPLPGSLAVLLYSWNKAAELDETLAALWASDLGQARVLVLDNGSTDATSQVLDAWQARAGGRLTRLDLPVNVGAAAARNWLTARPEVRQADFALYLDDDALVPPDWLHRLGAAVAARPDAAVWGCKVVDAAGPQRIQSADLHPVLPEPLDPSRPDDFRFSDLHIQTLDMGQFAYVRPCVSVTGCCHLFRSETLAQSGGFALHLSPSQYDDVEHDLRLARAGGLAVYQGHLGVRHKKRTGAASRQSAAELGNALGNKFKMQAMHPRAGMEAILRADRDRLLEDLLARLDLLEAHKEDR